MTTANYLRVLTGILAVACLLQTAEAKKKKPDFSEFKGKYSAQATTIIFNNTPYPATGSVSISVPKNGASATITVSGSLTAAGQVYPLSNTFTITRTTASVADIAFFVTGPSAAASGTATLNSRGTVITYNVVIASSPTIPITGTVTVKPLDKKKKTISLLLQFNASGNIYSFPFTGTAKVSKQ
jgi:hypothetical protein